MAASLKVSELQSLTSVDSSDLVLISDIDASASKKTTFSQVQSSISLANLGTKVIDNLTDVDTSTTAPTNGQVLAWDNTNSVWAPADQSTTATQASLGVDHLITLSGVAEGSDDLGTFTGTTITDSSTVKTALQELETAVEAAGSVLSGGDGIDITGSTVAVDLTAVTTNYASLVMTGGFLAGTWVRLSELSVSSTPNGTTGLSVSASGGYYAFYKSGSVDELLIYSTGASSYYWIDKSGADFSSLSGGDSIAATYTPFAAGFGTTEYENSLEQPTSGQTALSSTASYGTSGTLPHLAFTSGELHVTTSNDQTTAFGDSPNTIPLVSSVNSVFTSVYNFVESGLGVGSNSFTAFTGTVLNGETTLHGAIQDLGTQVDTNTSAIATKAADADVIKKDGSVDYTSDQSMGTNKITNLGTPTADADAATKGYVDTSVSNLVDSSPAALDTLNELAAALGDDANFSTTVTNLIGDNETHIDNMATLTGVAKDSTNLGSFTGDVIADSSTIKAALQSLETYVEGSLPVLIDAYNDTGSTLNKGDAVYINGTHASGKPTVALADSDGSGTHPAIGLIESTVTTGNDCSVVISGLIDGLDTSTPAWSVGDALYLDTTAGDLTNTRPSGASTQVQKIGIVTKVDSSTGSILIMGAGRTNDVPNEITALTGVSLDAVNLGTFTGSTISDNQTIKAALQDLETEVETKAASSVVTEIDGNVNDVITLTGIAENVTNLGTFTGSIITDSSTIKTALQELETYAEARTVKNLAAVSTTADTEPTNYYFLVVDSSDGTIKAIDKTFIESEG